MSFIADALRVVPGLGKAFAPGEIPVGGGQATGAYLARSREADAAAIIGDGQGTSIVQAVINWYLNAFPEAALRVMERDKQSGKRVAVDPHDLTDLLETPNEYYGGDELMAGLIISDIIDGNGYVLKLRNASTRVVEFWWIPHTLIKPMGSRDPMGPFIEYYEYRVSGRRYEIPVTEIVHIRHGLDPANPRLGMSRLKGQLREILTDEEAAKFSAALVHNQGAPGLVIAPKNADQTIGEADALVIKAKVDQTAGSGNQGRTVVMSGSTDIHQFGFSPEQMSLSAVRGVPEERLSAALGVPAAVVGFGTGLASSKVGATMSEFREMAVEQALVPMWRRFAKGLARGLTHEFAGNRDIALAYDTSEVRVLQEDRQHLHDRTRADVEKGILDVATSQAILGYPVDEGQRVYLRSPLQVEVPAEGVRA